MMKRASTCPWKGSVKQARNTYFLGSPVRLSSVVFGLVDQGVISSVWLASAISEAGMAPRLAVGPTIAGTLAWGSGLVGGGGRGMGRVRRRVAGLGVLGGGNGTEARVRPDDREHVVLGNELVGGRCRLIGLGGVVLDQELDLVDSAGDGDAARRRSERGR